MGCLKRALAVLEAFADGELPCFQEAHPSKLQCLAIGGK